VQAQASGNTPARLGGREVSTGVAQAPRAGAAQGKGSVFTRMLSTYKAIFKPAPTPGEAYMAKLSPRELIVYRSIMANIAEAAKDDRTRPELLKDREVLDKRLGSLPARMLEVAANEFPRAAAQQAAQPGSVEAAWGKLTAMAQDYLAEFARDNPGIANVSPHNKDQQRGVVSAMLNSFIRTGEMDEASLKQLLGSLPHEERQALLAEGRHFDTPVAKALLELVKGDGEAFDKDAGKLLALPNDAASPVNMPDLADTLASAAASYKTLTRAVETVNPGQGKPATSKEAADKAAALKAHMSALLSTHADKLDTLDAPRLQKLQKALDIFEVDMQAQITAAARRRLEAARTDCQHAMEKAITEAARGDLGAMASALDSACLAGSQADAAQRVIDRTPLDGEGDHAAILKDVAAKATGGLTGDAPARLAVALAGKDMATLQRSLAGAGRAGLESGSVQERETGARMLAASHLLGHLRGEPEPPQAGVGDTWSSDSNLTVRNQHIIKDSFGVNLDTDKPHRECAAAVTRACRAAASGNTGMLLPALQDAFASHEALVEARRHRGGEARTSGEQTQYFVNLINNAIGSLDGESRLRLREALQGNALHNLEAGLRKEASGIKHDAAAPEKAEAACKSASAAFLGELRQCASSLLNGGKLLAPAA